MNSKTLSRWRWLILIAAPLAYALASQFIGQDANWDLRNYHYYNAYALLEGRWGVDWLAAQTPSFYNPTLDVPFYLAAQYFSGRMAVFLLSLVQGLNFVVLFLLAETLLGGYTKGEKLKPYRLGLYTCIAGIGVLGAGTLAQLGTTFYDNVTSVLILTALLVVVSRSSSEVAKWILVGLLAGAAVGLKQTTITFALGLGFTIFAAGFAIKPLMQRGLCFAAGFTLGLLGCSGYWLVFLYDHFGNPLFPYFNDVFQSPLAPLLSARDTQFFPDDIWVHIFYPFYFTAEPHLVGEIYWQDFRVVLLFILVPLAGLWSTLRKIDITAKALLIFAAISYLSWAKLFCIYRYLLPLEMISLLTLAALLYQTSFKQRGMVVALASLALLLTTAPGNWGRIAWPEKFDAPLLSVSVPPVIKNPDQALVLLTSWEPYSYLLPSLPRTAKYLRVESNFGNSDEVESKHLFAPILGEIKAHKGDFYLLTPHILRDDAKARAKQLGLTLLPQSCHTIQDSWLDGLRYYYRIQLCTLKKADVK